MGKPTKPGRNYFPDHDGTAVDGHDLFDHQQLLPSSKVNHIPM